MNQDKELLGTAEVADLLNVERPRIARLMALGAMPEPIARLRATPIWTRDQIEPMRAKLNAKRAEARLSRSDR